MTANQRLLHNELVGPSSQGIACSILVLLCLSGCSKAPPELGKVEGQVTFEGKPVGPALAVFQGPPGGVSLSTEIDASGMYHVVMAEGEGLPLAEYKVAVTPPLFDFVTGDPPPKVPEYKNIPQRFRDPDTSGLHVKVNSGLNRFDIKMQP